MKAAKNLALVVWIVGWLPGAPAPAQTEFERRLEARPDGTVEISNVAGSITVVGWDRGEVEVTGILGRGVGEVDVEGRGGTVRVEVGRGPRTGHGGSAEIEVRVPRGSRLVAIESVSADVRVNEVDGALDIDSVSGSVAVRGRPRSVDVETISGNVDVEGAAGRVGAESVNGTIVVRSGVEVVAESVSGGIRLLGLENARLVEVSVVSGRIEFEGSLAKGADLELSSHNGSIEVALPAAVSARFEVSSFSGRIDNELGPPARRHRFSPARELDFVTGSGDGRVRIQSFAGSILLRKR